MIIDLSNYLLGCQLAFAEIIIFVSHNLVIFSYYLLGQKPTKSCAGSQYQSYKSDEKYINSQSIAIIGGQFFEKNY